MKFRKHVETRIDTEDILKRVNKCKPEELENLLKHIENTIEKSEDKKDLLMAKTITTSRLASMRSK